MPVPGEVRDAIIEHLRLVGVDQSASEILTAVQARLGEVPKSSVRSYLGINTPGTFVRHIGSVFRNPRSIVIPSASSPIFSVFGTMPTATMQWLNFCSEVLPSPVLMFAASRITHCTPDTASVPRLSGSHPSPRDL